MSAKKPTVPTALPEIPVILRWMVPGTQEYLFNRLSVATTMPALPRVGDYVLTPPPKAGRDGSFGDFDGTKRSVDATVRAVRFTQGFGPHNAGQWQIEIFLDAVVFADGTPDPRVRRPQ